MGGSNGDSMGFSVDENVFEMHTRRAGGSISSGMSEVTMSDMDSVDRSRTMSVSSVGSAQRFSMSKNLWHGENSAVTAQDRSGPPSAVINALQQRSLNVGLNEPGDDFH
jgi:hypothetical protein